VYVGVLQIALLCPESHSLKDKRSIVRRIKDRVHQRFSIAIAEVGSLDSWQRAELGVAIAGSDRDRVASGLVDIVKFVRGLEMAQLIEDRRDVFVYGDDRVGWRETPDGEALVDAAERTGAGDKTAALGGDGDDWVPAEWKEDR
jgi:uncharacterized protein YlxP (DUF503 family)